jgi:repressor LexA
MEVGTLLKSKREALGLTLEDVAEAVGINKSTILRWERGDINNMKRDKISKLADTLQISPLEILGIEPKNNSLESKSNLVQSLNDLSIPKNDSELSLKKRMIMYSLMANPRFEDIAQKLEKMPKEDQERVLNMIESIIENSTKSDKE